LSRQENGNQKAQDPRCRRETSQDDYGEQIMLRRTFLKTVIAMVAIPGLPSLQAKPEAIFTAKTTAYDARIALGEWFADTLEKDLIRALSGI